jgi:hypothetical protein
MSTLEQNIRKYFSNPVSERCIDEWHMEFINKFGLSPILPILCKLEKENIDLTVNV